MEVVNSVGRRKTAVARVYLSAGNGNIIVNGKDYKEYFPIITLQDAVTKSLTISGLASKYDVKANIEGGGIKGQAEALSLGISRALVELFPDNRPTLKTLNLLRRDPRKVERKKPGQPKARKRFQFSKR